VRAVAVGHLRLRHLVCKRTSLRLKLGTEAQNKVLYRMENKNDSFERVEFGADLPTGRDFWPHRHGESPLETLSPCKPSDGKSPPPLMVVVEFCYLHWCSMVD
jgi:hypothetical protein